MDKTEEFYIKSFNRRLCFLKLQKTPLYAVNVSCAMHRFSINYIFKYSAHLIISSYSPPE